MNITKTLMLLFILFSISTAQDKKENNSKFINLNSSFSYRIMEPNQDLRKINIFLEERQNGNLENNSLIIGTSLIAISDYQKSNIDSKFGYLMRHPTATNEIGKEVSEAVLHSFQVSFSGAVNNWLAAYAEILYNPEQSFGSGTITSLERNQLQLRKGFIVLGDLNSFPIYGAIGKMDAPFGLTGSVNPFSNSSFWHAFAGLGYGAQIGFKDYGLHAKFMAVQGGAQFRAMHTPVGDSTSVPSSLNNFVADINYTLNVSNKISIMAGGSYLHGSAFCQDFPVTHFADCNDNNPAISYYGQLNVNNDFVLMSSFATTLEVWKGTHNPTPPLDVFKASKVTSLMVGAKYDLNSDENFKYTVSGEFSNFTSGDTGAPWERQNQYIVGASLLIKHSSKLFVELFRTEGYVPLNFISGSNPFDPFPPGQTHSRRDAESNGVVIGGQITL